ncbi:MAG TPA: MG2 domain-containing protein, partial [Thermoanaerobaculia bacterium]
MSVPCNVPVIARSAVDGTVIDTNRQRRPFRLGLLAAVAATAVLALGAAPQPAAKPAATPAKGGKVRGATVVPDRFLRSWDPVTVFFDRDLGPAGGGPEDAPQRFVKMAPEHPGAFRWLDARTLQFKPAEPWPPLARYAFTVSGATTSLDTLMRPPVSSLPAEHADGLDPVQSITLTFREPLDPQALARMLSIELRPLPGVDSSATQPSRVLTAQDFQVKTLDRSARFAPASYVLVLKQPIPLGTRAILHFRLSLQEETPESSLDLSFQTAEPFRVVSLGCTGQQAPISSQGSRYGREQALACLSEQAAAQVTVAFSAPLAELTPVAARNLVRFEPAVPGLTFTVADRLLQVGGNFSRDTLYKLALAPGAAAGVADKQGRKLDLASPSEVFLYFPQRESFVRWAASQGIAERYGPKRVPVEGRGDERLDLRIFPVDPLDRSLWPFPDSPVLIDESRRPPGPGEEAKAWTDPRQRIPPVELERHIRAFGSPPVSTLVALPLRRDGSSARFGLDLAPYLQKISGRDAPGTYLVGLRRLDTSSTRAWLRLQVTDLSLTAVEEPRAVLFTVTSLASAKAVAGAQVRVEATVRNTTLGDWQWKKLFEGATDATGKVRFPAPGDTSETPQLQRIVVTSGKDVLVLDPTHAPDRYEDGQWTPAHETWLQWTGEGLGERGPQPETLVHIFTERPVYRPEELVHIKGYVRRREKGELTPVRSDGTLVVNGPGDLVWRYPAKLTAAGSFYQKFDEPKLPTGTYTAHFENKD